MVPTVKELDARTAQNNARCIKAPRTIARSTCVRCHCKDGSHCQGVGCKNGPKQCTLHQSAAHHCTFHLRSLSLQGWFPLSRSWMQERPKTMHVASKRRA